MSVQSPWIAAFGLLALSTAAAADQARDLILGNGTAGPYALAWKQIAADTESVQVNTLSQTHGLDYMFDPAAGTITFTRPLPVQAAAEVRYQYDPKHAVHTGVNLAVPLSLDIARGEHGSLSLDALYKHNGDAANAPGALTLGLGGGWQGGRVQFTTRLLFAPQLQPDAAGQSADALARAGLTLSGSTQVSSAGKLSFGYSRTGTGLGSAVGDNGWQSGVQTLTLGGSFAPSQRTAAFVDYTQADPLTAGQHMTTRLATGLTMTPSRALQLQTHWTQATTMGSATDTADISLDAKPNGTTELRASLSGKDAPGAKDDSQTLSFAAKASPSKSLSLQGQFGQSAAGENGTTQTAAVNVSAQPSKTAQVNATYALSNAPGTGSDSQAVTVAAKVTPTQKIVLNASAGQTRLGDASTDRQQIGLALIPQSQVQLHTGVILNRTDQFQTTAANFGGALKPIAFLQFSADYTSRTAPVADLALCDNLDTSTAQIALTPVKGLQVTGRYAQNPDEGGFQHVAQRGLRLQTVVGAVSLSGGYDWSRQYDTPAVGTALNLGLGLRLSSALQITGGYKQTLVGVGETPDGTSLYTFGLTHNLGDRFNLSMTGTMQQRTGQTVTVSPDYTASANLGMKF